MKTNKTLLIILSLVLVFSCLYITACSSNNKQAVKHAGEKPIVAVTIVPEKTFVEAVCKDLVTIITMVPPGNSPENYEPTPKEKELLSKAVLYFSIGVPTERTNILPSAGNVRLISLHDKIASVYPDRKFESGERDPHIWLSPKRVKAIVKIIAEEMGEIDKANKETYVKNAELYIKQLDEVDKEITTTLEGVKDKKFIVYHPAFGYLAEDYGLQMYALEKEGKEATAQHLQEMIDLAKRENIKVVFYQQEVDSKQSKAFAEEIGGRAVQLSPLDANYIDNLKKMARTMAEVMQ